MQPITEAQRRVLRTIVDYWREYGRPPTIREIMDIHGFASTNSVMCHVKPLQRNGYLVESANGKAKFGQLVPVGMDVVALIRQDEQGRRLREALYPTNSPAVC